MTIADEGVLAGPLGDIWDAYVNNILTPIGGTAAGAIAISVTAVMIIMGVLMYIVVNFIVLSRFDQIDAEQRKWPSAIIAIAFVFIMLYSGTIVLVASLLTVMTAVIALVVFFLVAYGVYAMGKKGFAGFKELSVEAGTSLGESRKARLETRKEYAEIAKEETELKRAKQAVGITDKLKSPVTSVRANRAKGVVGLKAMLDQLNKLAISGQALNNPQQARIVLGRARAIQRSLLSGEQYMTKVEEYEKSLLKATGKFNLPEIKKVIGLLNAELSKVEGRANKFGTDAEIKGTFGLAKDNTRKAFGRRIKAVVSAIKAKQKALKNFERGVEGGETSFNKTEVNLKNAIETLKSTEMKIIVPFRSLDAQFNNIDNGIAKGNRNLILSNVRQAQMIVNKVMGLTKSEIMNFKNLDKIEGLMKVELNKIEQALKLEKVDIKTIDVELAVLEKDIAALSNQLKKERESKKGKAPQKGKKTR